MYPDDEQDGKKSVTDRDFDFALALIKSGNLSGAQVERLAAAIRGEVQLADFDPERIRTEIEGGNRIQAIKAVRVATKCGLREAKDFVDANYPVGEYPSRHSHMYGYSKP